MLLRLVLLLVVELATSDDRLARQGAFAALLSDLDNCTHRPRTRIADCMNLAPAGTGSTSVFSALRQYSNYSHHNHATRLPQRATVNGRRPTCFILTVREPAARLASLLRYAGVSPTRYAGFLSEFGLANATADDLVAALKDARDARHADALRAVPDEFWIPQVSYVEENSCARGRMEIHVLCTERLSEDLRELMVDTFGVAGFEAARVNDRSRKFASAQRAETEIESAALRDFVNYELGARDFELHQHFCAGRGTHGEVAADVAARSQRPRRPKPIAQLEAQAAALASRARPGLPS